MRQRLGRLTLGAAVAFVALAPATSHAINCSGIEKVCATVGFVCNQSDVGKTVCAKLAPL